MSTRSKVIAILAGVAVYIMVAGKTYAYAMEVCPPETRELAFCDIDSGFKAVIWPIYWLWTIGMRVTL